MREYVEVRLSAESDPAQYESVKARSEEIQMQLWSIVEKNVEAGRETPIMALFVGAINEVINVHRLRVTEVEIRLPRLLGIVMYATIILSFLLVGIARSSDGKRNLVAILLLALAFVAVLIIIVDLDRPQQGLINVSQVALSDLLGQMTSSGS